MSGVLVSSNGNGNSPLPGYLETVRLHYQEYRPAEMSVAELEQLEWGLSAELSAIKAELDGAKAERVQTGRYADADWFRRATEAQRIKGLQVQYVARLRAARARQERATFVALAQYFMDAARYILNDKAFEAVYQEAEALKARAAGAPVGEA